MSRQFKNGRCSCWKQVNNRLEPEGVRLSESFTFTGEQYLNIETESTSLSRSRKRTRPIVACYCPFCGLKLKTAADDVPKGKRRKVEKIKVVK